MCVCVCVCVLHHLTGPDTGQGQLPCPNGKTAEALSYKERGVRGRSPPCSTESLLHRILCSRGLRQQLTKEDLSLPHQQLGRSAQTEIPPSRVGGKAASPEVLAALGRQSVWRRLHKCTSGPEPSPAQRAVFPKNPRP